MQRPRFVKDVNRTPGAVGSVHSPDVKQHSEDSNFPGADVACLLHSTRGTNLKAKEPAEPPRKLGKNAAGALMKILSAVRIARFDLLRGCQPPGPCIAKCADSIHRDRTITLLLLSRPKNTGF